MLDARQYSTKGYKVRLLVKKTLLKGWNKVLEENCPR